MRKAISLLLALSMVFSLCACGNSEPAAAEVSEQPVEVSKEPVIEEFVLRNDIKFGDSEEDVVSKETLPIRMRGLDNDGGDMIWTEFGTVSGYDETTVGFWFGKSQYHLNQMQYYFNAMSESSAESRREAIYDGLVRKYGEPLEIEEGRTYPLTTNAFYGAGIYSAYKFWEIYDYHEWLIPVENENYAYVKIDMVSYYYGSSSSDLEYGLRVGYKTFTMDDVMNYIEDSIDRQEQVDKDL